MSGNFIWWGNRRPVYKVKLDYLLYNDLLYRTLSNQDLLFQLPAVNESLYSWNPQRVGIVMWRRFEQRKCCFVVYTEHFDKLVDKNIQTQLECRLLLTCYLYQHPVHNLKHFFSNRFMKTFNTGHLIKDLLVTFTDIFCGPLVKKKKFSKEKHLFLKKKLTMQRPFWILYDHFLR